MQCRSDDAVTRGLLADIDDAATRAAVEAERGILAELGSGCTVPVGAYAQIAAGLLALRAMIGDEAGGRARFGDAAGPADEAESLGRGLAAQLRGAPAATEDGPR